MKRLFIIMVIFLFTNKVVNAQPIIATYFSYSNVGNDYTFYLHSFFSFGSGTHSGPKIKWVHTVISNDTVFIKPIYDHRGYWAAFGSSSYDSAKYTNTNSGINYFNVSSNYITQFGWDTGVVALDTFWNQHDTTFYVGTSNIKEQNSVKALTIYPNPTSTYISLPITASELRIYNTYGQVVVQTNNVATQQPITVAQLSSGLYYIAVYDKERNKVGVGKFYKE